MTFKFVKQITARLLVIVLLIGFLIGGLTSPATLVKGGYLYNLVSWCPINFQICIILGWFISSVFLFLNMVRIGAFYWTGEYKEKIDQ